MSMFDLANITIGADPEIFVGKRNEIVSGHHLPFGTKETPLPTTNGSVQVDGLALEVNVRPSKTRFEFVKNCGAVMHDLERLVKEADNEMYLVIQPTARFTPQYLESLPDTAKELGCNPDWNAYTLSENERPKADGNFRTAGGHIHIGWGDGFNPSSLEHIAQCAMVAQQLDYTVGLASLDYDRDALRRELYGKAGSFRPKPYGMEYRTLSPMWLLSLQHISLVHAGCIKALRFINEDKILDTKFQGLARSVIDSGEYKWRELYPELEQAIA
jgi:hypothetical protein